MNTLGVTLDPDCVTKFNELKLRRKYRYIVISVKDKSFVVEHLGDRNESEDAFVKYLNNIESRFIIVDHDYLQQDQYTPNGRQISRIYIISWIPISCSFENKILYTSCYNDFKNHFSGTIGLNTSDKNEIFKILGDHGGNTEEMSSSSDSDSY